MKSFVLFMRLMTLVYGVGAGLFFFFAPLIARVLGMEEAPDQFWITLSVSMMAMLAYVSWQSGKNPREKHFVRVHLLAKMVSVAGFLFSYMVWRNMGAYLVGVVTDASVIVLVLFFYRRAFGVADK